MFKRLIAAALLFGMAATAPPAFAQACATRDALIERLQSKYAEAVTGRGLQNTQTTAMMVEVWVSEKTGTFTVFITSPQGISCVVAAGTDWFRSEPEQELAGTPS